MADHCYSSITATPLAAGIFVAIIPVIGILQAGSDGIFAFLLQAVTTRDGSPHEAAYFWLTGGLSAFLDNAPTYLVQCN
jgi:Na+/H+ antiporter NhaD/arsenite permease-like protein